MLLLFLPVKAANVSQIDVLNQSEHNSLMMETLESLTLHDTHAKNGAVTMLRSLLPIKRPIRLLFITRTKSLVNDRTYITTNLWRSIDAHSKIGAITMMLSLLPIKAPNKSVMHYNVQVTGELPYLQDHKSLTLC
jgi:hypothetical protein